MNGTTLPTPIINRSSYSIKVEESPKINDLDTIPDGLYKEIYRYEDMAIWQKSPAKHNIIDFISRISNCIMGKSSIVDNETIEKLMKLPIFQESLTIRLLDRLEKLINDTPPTLDVNKSGNFGDLQFRYIYDTMRSDAFLKDDLLLENAPKGVLGYFYLSWGDRTRLDYGTGHELNFLCHLYSIVTQDIKLYNDSELLANYILCKCQKGAIYIEGAKYIYI